MTTIVAYFVSARFVGKEILIDIVITSMMDPDAVATAAPTSPLTCREPSAHGTNSEMDPESIRRRGGPQRDWVRRSVVVMQFNVLAKIYESDHLPDHSGLFENRRETIASQIDYHGPDVIALNECNPVSWYRDRFQGWYDVYFSSKADGMRPMDGEDMLRHTNDHDDGTAVLLKRGVVTAIKMYRIPLREPAFMAGVPSDNPLSASATPARQFSVLVLCHHIPSNNLFFFCTMHMKANPLGPQTECPRRIGHMLQLFAAIERIRSESVNAPIVFAGDFNSPPGTPTMDFLLRGRATVMDRVYEMPNKHLKFDSAFGTSVGTLEPDFTILSSQYDAEGWSSVLDYILVERGKFSVASFVTTPQHGAFGNDAIPHSGSDHIPLIVELAFNLQVRATPALLQSPQQQQQQQQQLYNGFGRR